MRALRSFSWKAVAVFFVFTAALSAWTWSGVLLLPKTNPFTEQLEYFLNLWQRNLLHYFPIYLLVGLADALPLRDARRRAALGVALVLGVLLSVQVRCAVLPTQYFNLYGSTPTPYCASFPAWRTYFDFYQSSVITPLTIGGLVMLIVFGRRRNAELVAALHKTRAEQLEARRQRIESDIEAMRSRVDSESLFESLREIRARYEVSLDEGEAMLDRLIGRLREAARA